MLGDVVRIRPALQEIDITKKRASDPPPWSEPSAFAEGGKQPPWVQPPQAYAEGAPHHWDPEPPFVQRRAREFPQGDSPAPTAAERAEKAEGASWGAKLRRWLCLRRRRERDPDAPGRSGVRTL